MAPRGDSLEPLGTQKDRRIDYLKRQAAGMAEDFRSLNMGADTSRWFVLRAQSANPYQKAVDDRQHEMMSVLRVLNQMNARIDREFIEISGAEEVSLKIDGDVRQLQSLSTGFSALLKIVQAIVEGFGSLTNASEVERVNGMVFIDEIESHLHVGWQTRVMKLLRAAFPATTFYVTTHSPLVLAQCVDGEVYELARDTDNVVRSRRVPYPGNAAFVDLLRDAFGVDVNRMKLDRGVTPDQMDAKRALLDLVREAGPGR